MKQLISICLVFGLLGGGYAHGAMYKWTDDDGNTFYSQNPPPNRKAKYIPPPKPVKYQAENKTSNETEGGGSEKWLTEQAMIAKKNCETSRNNLNTYKTASRYSQDGKIVELDEKTRKSKMAEAQQQVDKYCQ